MRDMLVRVQRMRKVEKELTIYLVSDDADWLAILQWMQDHGLFASGQKRPPLKAFVAWVEENQIPQLLTICNSYYMSMANRELHGARYPWKEITDWYPNMLKRWRALYQILNKKYSELV